MILTKVTSIMSSCIRTSPHFYRYVIADLNYLLARSLVTNCEKNLHGKVNYHGINPCFKKLQSFPLTFHLSCRHYAKGKDKKKEKGKKKVTFDERILDGILPVDDVKKQMQTAIDQLKEEYIHALSLRSTTGSIESLLVSFEGKDYSVQELAQVVRKDNKTVIINLTSFPQAIQAVLKGLQKSGMNLNPQQDGTTLYIPIPKVTTEHREQLAKNAKTLFIQCRDSIKKVQVKYEKKLKDDASLSQDTSFSGQQQLSVLAESFILTATTMFDTKIKELIGK